ncbi:MAG: response regulator transcription factor [Candidatus Geothermincolales bacterium]
MSERRILIIEDERPLAEALAYSLGREGYLVEVAGDGETGLSRSLEEDFDLILLDLMLPGLDGLEVCRELRKVKDTPVIVITARDSDVDKVVGLEMGADDYVTKPFNPRELLARVKAVLRRAERMQGEGDREVLRVGELVLDRARHEVWLDRRKIELSPIEFRLLECMMEKPGKVLSRNYLINRVWEGDFYGTPKVLDVHIRKLRKKLEEDPSSPRWVITVRGVGYRLEKPGSDG